MPTKTLCPRCRRKSCSGELWEYVSITEYPTDPEVILPAVAVDMTKEGNELYICQGSAQYQRENLEGDFAVGDEVTLHFPNWTPPSIAIVRKIED